MRHLKLPRVSARWAHFVFYLYNLIYAGQPQTSRGATTRQQGLHRLHLTYAHICGWIGWIRVHFQLSLYEYPLRMMSHACFQQRLMLASTTCHAQHPRPGDTPPPCPFAWRLNNKLIWGTKRQLKLKSVSRRRPWWGQLGTEWDREHKQALHRGCGLWLREKRKGDRGELPQQCACWI